MKYKPDNTMAFIEMCDGLTNIDRYDFIQTLRQIRDLPEAATNPGTRPMTGEGAA